MIEDAEILKIFGNNLKRIRAEEKMTLRDLEAECGINNPELSKMENGKINVSIVTIAKLSSALKCNPEDLLRK